jgi:hypothetical protein
LSLFVSMLIHLLTNDIFSLFVDPVRSEGGSECRQVSVCPNGGLDSAIGMEARKSPEAKIERSPTPTLSESVTPTEDTGSTDGGADPSD